jgi:hypothetical protein
MQTRLTVHNLPLDVDEKALRSAFVAAAKQTDPKARALDVAQVAKPDFILLLVDFLSVLF